MNSRTQNNSDNAPFPKSKANRNGSPNKAKRNDRHKPANASSDLQPLATYRSNDASVAHQANNGYVGTLPGEEDDENHTQMASNRSIAPTVATNAETVQSDAAYSKAGTSNTLGKSYASGGGNSVFSSPNASNRSLTTTLTTIQSTAPAAANGGHSPHTNGAPNLGQPNSINNLTSSSQYFSHQFPTTPASAVPAHLSRHGPAHIPTSYRGAVANNLLTDNASILTLASSSHRHGRRNSMDTDASVRAIAPNSLWGGSRESLPLSVLSQTQDNLASPLASPHLGASPAAPSSHLSASRSLAGMQGTAGDKDRASLYSVVGVTAPALSSERNSVYAGRSGSLPLEGSLVGNGGIVRAGPYDGGSVRSGTAGHGRSGSTAGSSGGLK